MLCCSVLEQQGLEDLDKAHRDMALKVKQARDEATKVAGGQALIQSRLLQELSDQSIQVSRMLSLREQNPLRFETL